MADSVCSATSASTTASAFRAKVAAIKSWRPENTPSNRDRLEMYALHKQSVSGDAPPHIPSMASASIPEKAKMNAWRSKRGISQMEAKNLYISECDRQMRVYGTASATTSRAPPMSDVTSPPPGQQTPTNTPHGRGDSAGADSNNNNNSGGSTGGTNVLLTPRGLTAVPLLCAAASESRVAYLARLAKTTPSQGWWAKQEPLCADPGTLLAIPETIVLTVAAQAEALSLTVGESELDIFALTHAVIQSFLWPLHNVLLAVWIVLIFIYTLVGSASICMRTMLLGSNTTQVPLSTIFSEEILPAAKTATSLCEPHQAISTRLVGLALMPFVTICDISYGVVNTVGILPGSMLYTLALVMTWWYWLCVIPWCTFAGITISITSGWCFALIEMAGIIHE